jgi:hypothetical protein
MPERQTVSARESRTGRTVKVSYSMPDGPRRTIECPVCQEPSRWRGAVYRCRAGHEATPVQD